MIFFDFAEIHFETPFFDPFIARGYGSPQWMGGFEALDGIFVYSIAGNSETEEPPVRWHFDYLGPILRHWTVFLFS